MYNFQSKTGPEIKVLPIDKDGDIEIEMNTEDQWSLIYLPRKEILKLINHLIQTCEITQDEII